MLEQFKPTRKEKVGCGCLTVICLIVIGALSPTPDRSDIEEQSPRDSVVPPRQQATAEKKSQRESTGRTDDDVDSLAMPPIPGLDPDDICAKYKAVGFTKGTLYDKSLTTTWLRKQESNRNEKDFVEYHVTILGNTPQDVSSVRFQFTCNVGLDNPLKLASDFFFRFLDVHYAGIYPDAARWWIQENISRHDVSEQFGPAKFTIYSPNSNPNSVIKMLDVVYAKPRKPDKWAGRTFYFEEEEIDSAAAVPEPQESTQTENETSQSDKMEQAKRFAKSKVELARKYLNQGYRSLAIKKLREAIEMYPGTEGASEAEEMLKALNE